MSRPTTINPKYRLHKASGQAICTFRNSLGIRKDVLLGKYDSAESWERYHRACADWLANKREHHVTGISVAELILRYWQHAQEYYQGRKSEMGHLRMAFRPLKHLFGALEAKDFGPTKLKAVRELMVTGYKHPDFAEQKPLARKTINYRVGRLRRLFQWGVGEELIPATVHHALEAVPDLHKGHTSARECPKVKPVPSAFVSAILPHVATPVRAMIELQELTGMRPGEVVIMRGCDLETSGDVWVYRPGKHKTEHHDIEREVYLGPKAQQIIKPFLRPNLQEYLFSPIEAREERFRAMRQARQSRVQPSQVNRRKRKGQRLPGERYTTESYGRAIKYGCLKAEVPAWAPNQLRHSAATNLRKEFGLEMARIILGHQSPAMTTIYAEVDRQKAMSLMGNIG